MGTTLRRRFVFPAGDVVTGSPLLDRPLDRVLWTLRTGRIGRTGTEGVDAAVFGFPRSGNTMLAAWLQAVARPGVRVHDGRVTHSALDVLRFTQAGIPIVIPVRNPMDACASFLVRQGRPEDARHGARLLDAYGAWFRMTRRSLASPMVTAMAFEAVTDDPALLAQWTPVVPLVEHDAVATLAPEVFVESLRHQLADVVGQGVEQDGVPAPWLISVPDAGRSEALRRARVTLTTDECAPARRRAEHAHDAFVADARASHALIEPRLPEHPTHVGTVDVHPVDVHPVDDAGYAQRSS